MIWRSTGWWQSMLTCWHLAEWWSAWDCCGPRMAHTDYPCPRSHMDGSGGGGDARLRQRRRQRLQHDCLIAAASHDAHDEDDVDDAGLASLRNGHDGPSVILHSDHKAMWPHNMDSVCRKSLGRDYYYCYYYCHYCHCRRCWRHHRCCFRLRNCCCCCCSHYYCSYCSHYCCYCLHYYCCYSHYSGRVPIGYLLGACCWNSQPGPLAGQRMRQPQPLQHFPVN